MRAFVYGRVSTREQSQEDHYSLENQEQRCRDYAAMKKWQILKARKDIASGKNDSRDGFQELLSDIGSGLIDVVLVYRLDRLSRNVRDIYHFLDVIKDQNVAFVSVTEGFDTTTAMGRAMLGVAAVFAQLTREMISENTKDGMLRRAEAGLYNGNPLQLTGYDYSKETGLVINPSEADVIREIFERYTEDKWGQSKIAHSLNLRGILSRNGVQWADNRIGFVLRNRIYMGDVRVKDAWIKGQHEAIVSEEVFETAQEILRGRAPLPNRAKQSPHLLSGIARCSACGKRLRIHYITPTDNGRYRNGPPTYRFYGHRRSVKIEEPACKGLMKNADALEAAVIERIQGIATSGQMERLVLEEVKGKVSNGIKPLLRERDQLLLELDTLGDSFSKWADRLDSGRIDEDQFTLQNKRLLDRKQDLQSKISALEQALGEEEAVGVTLAEVKRALKDFPKVWDALALEEKREMLRLLVERLDVGKTTADLKLLFIDPLKVPMLLKRGRKPKRELTTIK